MDLNPQESPMETENLLSSEVKLDDKVPDSSENSVAQTNKNNKGKKRKKPKDSTAPRQPLTGDF